MKKTLFTLLISFSVLTYATPIYKWVDQNGQVHFAGQPPLNQEAELINLQLPRTSTTAIATDNQEATSTQPEQATPAATPKISKEEQQRRQRNCQIALKNKELLSANFNRRYQQEDGSVRPYTDEERQAKLTEAQALIKEFCD